MAVTGWWFILWLWAPIYGNILAVQLFEPLWATLKWTWPSGGYAWFGTHTGMFVVSLITIALAGVLVSIGMAGYAKIQRWCFIGGMIGFLVIVLLLLVNSHASFVSSFNPEAQKIFGVQQRLRGHHRGRAQDRLRAARRWASARSGPTMLLVPLLMFFLLWPNWGVDPLWRDPRRQRLPRVFTGMFAGLWITVALHGRSSCC